MPMVALHDIMLNDNEKLLSKQNTEKCQNIHALDITEHMYQMGSEINIKAKLISLKANKAIWNITHFYGIPSLLHHLCLSHAFWELDHIQVIKICDAMQTFRC